MNINISGIVKEYGDFILEVDDTTILSNEIIGLVGNNGAGKTTLLKLVSSLVLPDKGFVLFNNENILNNCHWKDYTGIYIDESCLIPFYTVKEFYQFIAHFRNLELKDLECRLEKFNSFFCLDFYKSKKRISDYSLGNRKKIGIIASLIHLPDFVILDEPFANLDPRSVSFLIEYLSNLKSKRNTTILISSHDIHYLKKLVDRCLILENGKVVSDITSGFDKINQILNN